MSRRSSWPEVWLGVAKAIGGRSSCLRDQVGAVLVVNNFETYVGYNGPESGWPNCEDGGCPRGQKTAEELPHGALFDGPGACTAVHAEMNAVRKYLRHHKSVTADCVLYTTREPCHDCWERLLRYRFHVNQVVWS